MITMTLCGRTIVQAVGTATGVGFIIGLAGCLGFCMIGLMQSISVGPPGSLGFVNLPALLAISLASLVTAPIGAKLAHDLEQIVLKRMFGIYLIAVSITMFVTSS